MFVTVFALVLVGMVIAAFVLRVLQIIGQQTNEIDMLTYERNLAQAQLDAVMQYKETIHTRGQTILLPRSPFEST